MMLVLSPTYSLRGGIQRFHDLLCLALDELAPALDLRATVICIGDSRDDFRRSGRQWRHLTFVPGGSARRAALLAWREAARLRPELLLVALVGMTPLGLACRPWLSRGYGFVAHGMEAWAKPRRLRRLAARRASFAFAVSENTRAALAASTSLPRERIRLLPNALEPRFETLPDAAPEPASEPPEPELLTVARLWADEKMKGVDHTLRVVARLLQRHPRLRYRIVGKGSDKPRLERLAAELGLGQRVLFQQDVSDEELADCYRRCRLFVLPSGQEGFGIVFLEAMRFAKACIGGDAGGTPEVIEHERTGLLVPFGDEAALELALERLLDDPALCREMGERGRERLLERFSFTAFRERLRGHLETLLDGSVARAS